MKFWNYVMMYLGAAPGISASPSEENMRYFNVIILGPEKSPYEGNIFSQLWSQYRYQWVVTGRDLSFVIIVLLIVCYYLNLIVIVYEILIACISLAETIETESIIIFHFY